MVRAAGEPGRAEDWQVCSADQAGWGGKGSKALCPKQRSRPSPPHRGGTRGSSIRPLLRPTPSNRHLQVIASLRAWIALSLSDHLQLWGERPGGQGDQQACAQAHTLTRLNSDPGGGSAIGARREVGYGEFCAVRVWGPLEQGQAGPPVRTDRPPQG